MVDLDISAGGEAAFSKRLRGRLYAVACAVAAVLALLAGCDISRPEIRLRDIEIAAYDFDKIELTYVFEVANPNSYIVTLWGFDFQLISAGEEFARSSLAKPCTAVPSGSYRWPT